MKLQKPGSDNKSEGYSVHSLHAQLRELIKSQVIDNIRIKLTLMAMHDNVRQCSNCQDWTTQLLESHPCKDMSMSIK